jgi:hypothetical protein
VKNLIKKILNEGDWDWVDDVSILDNLDKTESYKVWFGDSLSQEEQVSVIKYLKDVGLYKEEGNLTNQTTFTSLFIKHLEEHNNYGGRKGWNTSHMGCLKYRMDYYRQEYSMDDEEELKRYCFPEDGYKLHPRKIESDRKYFEGSNGVELPKDLFL